MTTDAGLFRAAGTVFTSSSMTARPRWRDFAAHVHFRNEVLTDPAGSQILLDDLSGNPIELFLPRRA